MVASEEGKSQTSDQTRITEAIRRFDARVNGILDFAENGLNPAELYERLRQLLQDEMGLWLPCSSIARRLVRILEKLPRLGRRLCRFLEIDELSQLLQQNHHRMVEEPKWTDFWKVSLQCGFPEKRNRDVSAIQLLDQAAQEFLTSVQSVWNLESIGDFLAGFDELVLWVDDELHNVPTAFLKTVVQGEKRFLCQAVPSIRTIVSPVLDRWMKDAEPVPGDCANIAELLSISWFEDGGSSERAVEHRLLEVLHNLASRTGNPVRWRAATRDSTPSGTHRALARVLEEQEESIALAVICGHGLDSPHGVILGDGVWTGAEHWSPSSELPDQIDVSGAHELGRIDFLAILSCSIGRIKHSGTLDVSGFCTDLFVNGARSIFAGRWPLIAGEAIALFDAVARVYLPLRTSTNAADHLAPASRTRGKAVNSVRCAWAQGEDNSFGLYTACSMELFGLS